jgi:endonuclease/exonuclease/phosphatase family metal-dependent hydrolase
MMKVSVLTWNIMIPVLEPIRYYGQQARAERIPRAIDQINNGVDVVVFNELIPSSTYTQINANMFDLGFVHTTQRLTDILTESGGVSIYSKFPILDQAFVLFGSDCAISDCLSAKGVVYSKINKDGFIFNVFATHFQAGEDYFAIREAQTQTTRKFIQAQNINKSEAVLFCGDLNTGMYVNNAETKHITFTLGMDLPELGANSHVFTVDPRINPLVGIDDPDQYKSKKYPDGCVDIYLKTKNCVCCDPEWLDYTLVSNKHLKATKSSMTSLVAKTDSFHMDFTMSDSIESEFLSDHFPVLGHFEFPFSENTSSWGVSSASASSNCSTNPNTGQSALFIVLILVVIGLVLALPVYYCCARFRTRQVVKVASGVPL